MPDKRRYVDQAGIPYPPVFRDWEHPDWRVATSNGVAGVAVEMYLGESRWKRVELTEEDACLMAASLLQRAGRDKLARKVLRALQRAMAGGDDGQESGREDTPDAAA